MTEEIKRIFNHIAALPWVPTGCTPLFFQNMIAGSEFLTYDANKLYICSSLTFGTNAGASAVHAYVGLWDQGDVNVYLSGHSSIAYEAVAPAVWGFRNDINIQETYFSRITVTTYNTMKFNGWRLTR